VLRGERGKNKKGFHRKVREEREANAKKPIKKLRVTFSELPGLRGFLSYSLKTLGVFAPWRFKKNLSRRREDTKKTPTFAPSFLRVIPLYRHPRFRRGSGPDARLKRA
jgi:hypothetical protein